MQKRTQFFACGLRIRDRPSASSPWGADCAKHTQFSAVPGGTRPGERRHGVLYKQTQFLAVSGGDAQPTESRGPIVRMGYLLD